MPSSLRFVLGLVAIAIVVAPVSVFMLYHQDDVQARVTAEAMTGGSRAAGKIAIARFGCGGCHEIPGIAGARGQVGPALAHIAVRAEIAGRLSNQPANMLTWLRHPQAVVPGNGMPDQGIGDRDARDIAAYLYALK